MVPPHERPDPEELLAQAGWLRRLALSLAGDPARAEDLVQETFLTALARPPRERGSLRAWLARVVRNRAAEERRGEARRRSREEQRSAAEALPSAEELVAELDAQRTVARELMELPEPYRSALLLRFYRDLAPADIARLRGVPAGTVRSWTTRGLALLRERLDRREGGSAARLLALAAALPAPRGAAPVPPNAPAEPSLAAGTLATGTLTMHVALKLTLAAGLAGLAFLGWSELERSDLDARPALAGGVEPELADLPEPAAPALADGSERIAAADEQRTAAAPREVEPAPTPAPAAAEGPSSAHVLATFVDEAGTPQPGILLQVVPRATGPAPERMASAGSDPAGEVRVEVPFAGERRRAHEVRWSGSPFASGIHQVQLGPGEERSLGTIVLEPGAAVAGRVVDRRGAPLAGVRLWWSEPELDEGETDEDALSAERLGLLRRHGKTDLHDPGHGRFVTTSSEDGRYELEGVPAGEPLRVWAWREDLRHAWSAVLVLQPRERRAGVDLELEPLHERDRIAGRIVDPEGRPVADAILGYSLSTPGMSMSSTTPVDTEGRFDLVVWRDVPHQLVASVPDGRLASASRADVAPGSVDLVLVLGEADQGVRLVVTEPGGAPVEEYEVHVVQETGPGTFSTSTGARRHEDGETWIDAPPGTFRLMVRAQGFAPVDLGPYEGGSVPGGVVEVELEPLPGISGRVLADGRPVVGAVVSLLPLVGERERFEINGFPSRVRTPSSSTRSGEDGSFVLYPQQSGDHLLRAELEGYGLAEEELWVDLRRAGEGHRLELPAAGALRVRVVRADGGDAAGTIVGLNRHDGRARTVVAGAGGEVLVEGLTPGGWAVSVEEEELATNRSTSASWTVEDGTPLEWPVDCTVVAGRTVEHELVVE